MSISDQPLDILFETAIHISDARERKAWMEQACQGNHEKLEELSALVKASEKTFLLDTPLV